MPIQQLGANLQASSPQFLLPRLTAATIPSTTNSAGKQEHQLQCRDQLTQKYIKSLQTPLQSSPFHSKHCFGQRSVWFSPHFSLDSLTPTNTKLAGLLHAAAVW